MPNSKKKYFKLFTDPNLKRMSLLFNIYTFNNYVEI